MSAMRAGMTATLRNSWTRRFVGFGRMRNFAALFCGTDNCETGIFVAIVRTLSRSIGPRFATPGASFANNEAFVCERGGFRDVNQAGCVLAADGRVMFRMSRSIEFIAATATSGKTSA